MTPAKYPAILFFAFAFALAWLVIALVTFTGVPTNSLHSSAQAWAFSVVIIVLGTFGATIAVDIWRAKQ